MNRITIFIAIYVVCFFALSSCKDECSKVTTRYEITPVLKDFYFKKGTYWVYEDTANHVVDSQYVYMDSFSYSYGQTKGENGGYCEVRYQFFKYNIQSIIAGVKDSFQYGTFANSVSNSHLVISKQYNGNTVLWLNKPVGQIQSNIRYNGTIFQNINGVDYSNVYWYSAVIGTGIGLDYLISNTDNYFVPKIGVVKKVEFGTSTGTKVWLLKNYFIIQ